MLPDCWCRPHPAALASPAAALPTVGFAEFPLLAAAAAALSIPGVSGSPPPVAAATAGSIPETL